MDIIKRNRTCHICGLHYFGGLSHGKECPGKSAEKESFIRGYAEDKKKFLNQKSPAQNNRAGDFLF